MMRRAITIFCCAWAAVGLAIFTMGFRSVNSDARVLVLSAGLVGVGSAGLAAWMAWNRHARWAGALLVLSIVTPIWYAAIFNLAPLLVGLALLVTGPTWRSVSEPRRDVSAQQEVKG